VPFNVNTVKCQDLRSLLHEISNEGARGQFNVFLEEVWIFGIPLFCCEPYCRF